VSDEGPDAPSPVDSVALLEEMLELLAVVPDGEEGIWIGRPATWWGDHLFGGFVIAQAIVAATRDVPPERRLHSFHAYFLRPASSGAPIHYRTSSLREGRTFSVRHLEARQHDQPILDATYSFTSDVDGYVYDLPGTSAPDPSTLVPEPGPGPWIAGFVGPTPERADGTRESTHRTWFRIPADLPEDEHLHTALLGFASDWTGIGGRPRHLDGDTQGMISLDHAVWFHRAPRADEWIFYDVHSLVNAGGRGLLRGVMRDQDGHVVVSVAQEMRLIPVEPL
jgi:acyl-CoA thioesterase II